MKPNIAITIGDFNGVGPEIILKSITHPSIKKEIHPVLIGSYEIFEHYAKKLKIGIEFTKVENQKIKFESGSIPVIDVHKVTIKQLQIGQTSPDAGVCAGSAIERAIKLCLEKEVDAMVTAPVSKEALHYAGYNFPGQTEMLAMLTRSERVTMMLLTNTMRVALATVHIPIKKVSENIFLDRLLEKLETINGSLKNDLGISSPTIAVLGLNPHAGENGAIGMEEKEIIIPAIKKGEEKGINVVGPFSADGFFASGAYKKYDAILAMYHDQGLIPLKMSGFDEGVNYSAGLKIIRTSPDHGTAFDIAGKGIANPGSMIAAIQLASSIAQRRKK
ncbi:MAG: 4-hydroxythreonine-4-phosphate dehydrogenase PdxA [Ignavibacteriales bacterium]|nr:4-hydroxythreonine-4-phosphate dehydrogenase PdxA [Ignavibacteriales bacterium]